MKKKGSHIGIILSFVIFVVFLVFLYSTLEPLIVVEEEKEFLQEYLEVVLVEKLKTNLTTLTITISESVGNNCIVLGDLIEDVDGLNSRIVVKSYNRSIFLSEISGNDLIVNRAGDNFLKVYGSEEFENLSEGSTSGCQILGAEYEIALLKLSEHISEARVEELVNNYTEGYDGLKEEFDIAEGSDFGFGFVYNNGTVIETESVNVSRSVYVEDVPVRYVDSDANVLTGFLRIKVW